MKAIPISLSITAAAGILLWAAENQPEIEAPLPPQEAADAMIVPEGFDVTLFAGEPDLKQPIGFCIDDRGRLWVAEAYSYPKHTNEAANDRIVIFEDQDNDGQFDKRTVFYDKLNYVSGIEVGFGGAWVMSSPSCMGLLRDVGLGRRLGPVQAETRISQTGAPDKGAVRMGGNNEFFG